MISIPSWNQPLGFANLGGRLAFLIVIGLTIFPGCQSASNRQNETPTTPVLLVGVDGVDWKIALPLMKMGAMPVVERLSRRGVMSDLLSPTMASPVEWTSIVTGKTPEKHGITTWAKPDEKARKEFQVLTRKNRTARTLWNMLSDNDLTVNVVGWWVSWPAEHVNGTLLTDAFLYRESLRQTVHPAESEQGFIDLEHEAEVLYRRQIEGMGLPPIEMLGDSQQPFSRDVRFASGQINTFYHQLRFDFIKHLVACSLMRKDPATFTAVYYRGSDLASHFFYYDTMGAEDSTQRQWDSDETGRKQQLNSIIPSMYRLYDLMIGDLLGNYTQQEPHVLVVSDHGFNAGAWYRNFKFKPFLKNSGLTVRGTPIMQSVASIETIDAQKQTFNLTIVDEEHGLASAALIKARELERLLAGLKTTEGNALCDTVTVKENAATQTVSLIIELNDTLSLTELVELPGPRTVPLFQFFRFSKFSGAHRSQGISLFHGAAFEQMRRITPMPRTLDICPIVLRLFNLPRGEDMDGRAPETLFTSAFRLQYPLQPEKTSWENDQSVKEEIPDIDAETNRTIVEELKSIGYL